MIKRSFFWSWQQESNLQPADYKLCLPAFVLFRVVHYTTIYRYFSFVLVSYHGALFRKIVDQKLTTTAG